jgi:hypothetical protein
VAILGDLKKLGDCFYKIKFSKWRKLATKKNNWVVVVTTRS